MSPAGPDTARPPDRPLAGRTVVVTRPREQAASLVEPLEALGASVLLAPTIRIEPRPLDDEVAAVLRELSTYQLVVFTSANAVRVFAGYLARGAEDGGMPAGPVVAAVGPATAAALEKHGLACHLVPDEYVAEGLLDAFEEQAAPVAGARVLIPCARDARDVLPETLRERGAVVDVLHIYDTVAAGELAVPAAQVEAADYITFTSASTARRLAALLTAGGEAGRRREAAHGAARRRPALLHRPHHQPGAARPRPDRGRGGPGVHGRGPRRGDRRRRAGAMSAVTIYGVCAVSFMMVMYALEPRGRGFVLAFAAGCLLSSAYGFLSGAWPFGVVEAVWAVVAVRRYLTAPA